MDAIAVRGLNFSYGSTQVLKQIDFTVPESRFAVLLGQNGAGKSTLLKLLLGELSSGEKNGGISIFGCDIRQFKNWKCLSYVPRAAWHPVRISRPLWRRSSRQTYMPRSDSFVLPEKEKKTRSARHCSRLGWKIMQNG